MAAFIGLLMLICAAPLWAQSRSLDEGTIVRRQLLYRSDRLEVATSLGHSLTGTYQRTAFLASALNYHLTNTFSLGLNAAWGALRYNTQLMDEIEVTTPSIARSLSVAETVLYSDFHLGYVPYYGKFNFLERTTVNFDFHLSAGVAGDLILSDSEQLSGFKFGPSVGGGMRFFLNGDTAINIELTDHIYSMADVQRENQRIVERFSHQVMLSVGASFFVTGELHVSR
jgi:outer membrane beta-barrel protein